MCWCAVKKLLTHSWPVRWGHPPPWFVCPNASAEEPVCSASLMLFCYTLKIHRCVYSRCIVENDRSLEAVVTGSVTRIWSRLWITGNAVWLHAVSTCLAFFGTALRTRLYHRRNSPTADSLLQCSTSAYNLYSCRRSCSSASVGSLADAVGIRYLKVSSIVLWSCDLSDAL